MFERVKITQLNDHIWLMDDNHEATGYLVVGSRKALVIDTMNGHEDIHAIVRTITPLPILVVNTHGHCDHIYGNIDFDRAFINPADLPLATQHCSFPDFKAACAKGGYSMPPFLPIKGGDRINLGGLTLDIFDLPGHTPGSILLLLREDRILFTGDAINHHLWLQLDESLPLQECLNNLDALSYLEYHADKILHGHAQGFDDISLFTKLRDGMRTLIEGRPETQPYNWFGGTDKIFTYNADGDAICYKNN